MKRFGFFVGGLATLALIGGAQEASARNIFDDFASAFFGAPARSVQPAYEPLEMTVKPRRKAASKSGTPKYADVSSKPAPPAVKLDPATDPNWFLGDPTLRRGDIVVTRQGVLVYQGRDSDALRRSDFASLGGKSGGKSWQQQLKAAAAGGRSYFSVENASLAPVQQATVKTP